MGRHVSILGKIRDPRINILLVRGFFLPFAKAPRTLFRRRTEMEPKEQSFSRITIFLIKDWDGFQRAMRFSNGKQGGGR
jgi:hypothetical protein